MLTDFRRKVDSVYAGDVVNTALVDRLREHHGGYMGQLHLNVIASLEAIFDQNHLRSELV